MTALSTTHGTSTLELRLADLGADCKHHSCPGCGRTLLEAARCSCPEDRPRVGRLHTSLLEADWASLQIDGLGIDPADRFSCHAHVLA